MLEDARMPRLRDKQIAAAKAELPPIVEEPEVKPTKAKKSTKKGRK